MTPPPRTDSAETERESPWPFLITAKVVAVPAPLARVGIGLLVALVLAVMGATCVLVAQVRQVTAAIHLLR